MYVQTAFPFAREKRVGRCRRCGRGLKDPASLDRGYGKVCWMKLQNGGPVGTDKPRYEDQSINIPLRQGIVVRRLLDGTPATNVPHLISTGKSPNGFEFGYLGSGPTELALNAIEAILNIIGYKGRLMAAFKDGSRCFELAWQCCHPFKEQFIASIDQKTLETVVPFEEVVAWVQQQVDEEVEDADYIDP